MKNLLSVLGGFLVSMWESLISSKMIKAIVGFFSVGFLSKVLFTLGITFITAGLMALGFMAFSGIQL